MNQLNAQCSDCRQQMELAADRRASFHQRRAVARHTANCPACRETWQALQQFAAAFSRLPTRPAPPHFATALRARLQTARPLWSPRPRLSLPAPWPSLAGEAGAALLLVACCAFWVSRTDHWLGFSRTAQTTEAQARALAVQARQLLPPAAPRLPQVQRAVWQEWLQWRHLGEAAGRWLANETRRTPVAALGPAWLLWGVAAALLLLNLLLEIGPASVPARITFRRRT
ncbi:MAG: hypothetical protein GW911_04260 [Armatimonadetes bacterium]|nr:hypothetical protein [Armatimonadota bacterium]NCO90319.1 hypothetical protein [Armatimonadota bacterium]NCP30445.1 hypothetical protein [Armatimonadota bacterium]NCQ30878.1 hypothetical protein [Armatimonadota bacterium]NDK11254.1 hypothetical protein [Armatimonadota bacterium]